MNSIAFRRIGLICLFLLSALTPVTGTCDEGDSLRADVVWLTPVRIVHASGPAFGSGPQEAGYDSTYGAAKVLDNDLASFCCLTRAVSLSPRARCIIRLRSDRSS